MMSKIHAAVALMLAGISASHAAVECGIPCDPNDGMFTPETIIPIDANSNITTAQTCQQYLDSTDFDIIPCTEGDLLADNDDAFETNLDNQSKLVAINEDLNSLQCCQPSTDKYICELCNNPINPDKMLENDGDLEDLVETCAEFVIAQESFLGDESMDQESLCQDLHADTVRRSCCECDSSLVDCDVVVPATSSPTMQPSGASTSYAVASLALLVQTIVLANSCL